MSGLDFEVIEFDGSKEHIELLSEVRVKIWSEGKSQEELGMGKAEILRLGEAYMAQPGFKAVIAVRNGQPIGYCLSYLCNLENESLNLAGETVVSPEAENTLKIEIIKQMNDFYFNLFGQSGRSFKEEVEEAGHCVFVMNGLGVVKEERGNFALVANIIHCMFIVLMSQSECDNIWPWGFFYTWKSEEKPSFYKQIGFKRLDFVDPEDQEKTSEAKTYWLANWFDKFNPGIDK